MPEALSLGGRFYELSKAPTVGQKLAYLALMHRTGVQKAIDERGDILSAVVLSGCMEEFIANGLVSIGGAWSKQGAAETAAHILQLTDDEEFQKIMDVLGSVVTGFLEASTTSVRNSPNASVAPAGVPNQVATDAPVRAKRRTKAGSGSPSLPPSDITIDAAPVT